MNGSSNSISRMANAVYSRFSFVSNPAFYPSLFSPMAPGRTKSGIQDEFRPKAFCGYSGNATGWLNCIHYVYPKCTVPWFYGVYKGAPKDRERFTWFFVFKTRLRWTDEFHPIMEMHGTFCNRIPVQKIWIWEKLLRSMEDSHHDWG